MLWHSLKSRNSFYLTHDHYITKRHPLSLLAAVETYLLLPGGHVDYVTFDESSVSLERVSDKMPFVNGIGLSPEIPDAAPRGRYVAVALSSSSRLVILYQPDARRTEVGTPRAHARRIKVIDLPFLPDNVVWREVDASTGLPRFWLQVIPPPSGSSTSSAGARLLPHLMWPPSSWQSTRRDPARTASASISRKPSTGATVILRREVIRRARRRTGMLAGDCGCRDCTLVD